MAVLSVALFSLLPVAFSNPVALNEREVTKTVTPAAATYAGEATSDIYPNPSATTADVSAYFPGYEEVGYPGPTPTGAESFLVQLPGAKYPYFSGYWPLIKPATEDTSASDSFDAVLSWGNLSPMQAVAQGSFPGGEDLKDASNEVPEGCAITQVHLLHRHGARYPTSGSGPAAFADMLAGISNSTGFTATGALAFLNDWEYNMGAEILNPFGREQLFQMGVGFRQKYGHLLNNFTSHLPVHRTTSEDRMVKSALNFAAGFYGLPYEDQYHQVYIIEETDFNNTLAPYGNCPNNNADDIGYFGDAIVTNWTKIYLKDATARIQKLITGVNLTIADVYDMQTMCPYETVSNGYSDFCQLFTKEEWEGFDYAIDLSFWYNSAFGNPTSAAIGLGWVQELVARLTKTPITTWNSSTNSTLDSSNITFPLDQSIYVDATHDTIISAIMTTLNMTFMTSTGPLPQTYIPDDRSFVTRRVSPFASQFQVQVLNCGGTDKIRFILNDAVVPISGLKGCTNGSQGLCDADVVISDLQEIIGEIDFDYACNGNYTVSYDIVNGRPPKQSSK